MPGKGFNDKSSPDADPQDTGATLLPMLIGGLILIVIGAIVVMNFV